MTEPPAHLDTAGWCDSQARCDVSLANRTEMLRTRVPAPREDRGAPPLRHAEQPMADQRLQGGGYAARRGPLYDFFAAPVLTSGRPRLFVGAVCLAAAIHAGGRPRRFRWPDASRSRLMMASMS